MKLSWLVRGILAAVLLVAAFALGLYVGCSNRGITGWDPASPPSRTVYYRTNTVTNMVRLVFTNTMLVTKSEADYQTNVIMELECTNTYEKIFIYETNWITRDRDFIVSVGAGIGPNGILYQVSFHKSIYRNIYGGLAIQNTGILVGLTISF